MTDSLLVTEDQVGGVLEVLRTGYGEYNEERPLRLLPGCMPPCTTKNIDIDDCDLLPKYKVFKRAKRDIDQQFGGGGMEFQRLNISPEADAMMADMVVGLRQDFAVKKDSEMLFQFYTEEVGMPFADEFVNATDGFQIHDHLAKYRVDGHENEDSGVTGS